MILPRLLGILNYHTQKSCVSHFTNYVRSQENTAATEAFHLSLVLFPSSRSWFRPSQLVREKPAPFQFSAKLWLEPVLPPPAQLTASLAPGHTHLSGSAPRRRGAGLGAPPTPSLAPRPSPHLSRRGGGQAQGPAAAACARLKRAGAPGLRSIRYHPEHPEIISPLHSPVTGHRDGGGWLPSHTQESSGGR